MEYILEMNHITKCFPGVVANNDITIQLRQGEILALLGENGAGKSTLMSILFGLYAPDKGEIRVGGQPVRIKNPNDATYYKIGMVQQHFQLVKTFTALENIVLGVEGTKLGVLQMKEARRRVEELSERYQLAVEPDKLVADMTVGEQQRVEILKMLYRNNDILILDEPTAVLTTQEISGLMDIMRNLIREGKSILFISHKLGEVMSVADRCVILRKGENVAVRDIAETNENELSELMVGRKVNLTVDRGEYAPGEAVLKVRDLCVEDKRTRVNAVDHVSFDVHAGEILCIAGIDGNGQRELVHAISGLAPVKSGTIEINGVDCTKKSVRFRTQLGTGHIPEDRHKHGSVLDFELRENLALQSYHELPLSNHGIMDLKAIDEYAARLIESGDIRSGEGGRSIFKGMSGGNQQKAVVARETSRSPRFLIAAQPTRGLDVGAIENIHRRLVELKHQGTGVLLVSLELDEVMSLSDRILIIYEGRLVGEVFPDKTDLTEMGLYMSGAKRDEVKCP